jgi:hypothetical protein
MCEQKFKLFMPCGHSTPYRIEGAVGATPDVGLLRLQERCWRSTLPPFLDNLVFNFVEIPLYATVRVQNFFHLGDFFIVSDSMKEFLEARAGCEFDIGQIRTKHPKGEKTGQYWAMKVRTRIDCVEPDKSFAKKSSWSSEPPKPFSEIALDVKLADDVAPYFANKDPDIYYAYPSSGIQRASLNFSSVPSGVKLFEPMYWPQYLVVEETFARELEKQCIGGTFGYYFWTLGFDDVSNEFEKTMQALR